MIDIERFVKQRNQVVWSFDVYRFKKYFKKYFKQKYPDLVKHDDVFILGVMAKMAMQITCTPKDIIEKAKGILDDLGWDYGISDNPYETGCVSYGCMKVDERNGGYSL